MTARAPDTVIASVAEAEHVIANLNIVLDRLMETVEEETALVRASNLREAAGISEAKTELSRRYTIESERVMAARVLIAGALPDAFDALRKRNAAFQILLQTNLTVLATAHAVSEGIIRGVSGELARKRAPSTYGASGRANAPAAKASQPLAISRTL
jgi:Na+-transporting NADH:ubiquinone oxidoreductase subunit NqrD